MDKEHAPHWSLCAGVLHEGGVVLESRSGEHSLNRAGCKSWYTKFKVLLRSTGAGAVDFFGQPLARGGRCCLTLNPVGRGTRQPCQGGSLL